MRANMDKLELQPEDLEVQTIMAHIQASLIEQAANDNVEYPTFTAACAQAGGTAPRFSQEMYYQLEQANLNGDQVWTELSLIESQMPLLGVLVNRFKREFHQLVIFYVNMLGGRQATVNDALLRTLNQLVSALERSPEFATREQFEKTNQSVLSLQSDLAELRARVQSLENCSDK